MTGSLPKIDRATWSPDLLEVQRCIDAGAGDIPRRCRKCGAEGRIQPLKQAMCRCLACGKRMEM